MQLKSKLVYWLTSPMAILFYLLGLTWIAYYDSLEVVFHFDDFPFIIENSALPNVERHWKGLFTLTSYSRAVTLLTLSLNYALHSFEVAGYHTFNISLHAFTSFLIFLLLSKLLTLAYGKGAENQKDFKNSCQFVAVSVAALFAVHPLLTSAVTYITQRSALLATCFYVAAFVCYLYMRQKTFRQPLFFVWGLLTLICFWLSYKSKSMALTWFLIPFVYEIVFRLHDWKQLQRIFKWALGLLVCFAAIIAWYLSSTNLLSGNYFVGFGSQTLWGPWIHLQTMFRVLVEYWKLLLLPLHQWMNIDHDFPISNQALDWLSMAALGFHLVLVAVSLFLAKKGRPLFALGVGWFYVTLGPYIIVPERDVMVEYKTYLPSVGVMLIVADLLFWLRQKINGRFYLLHGVVVLLLIFGIRGTIERNKDYYTTASVWKDAINKAPYKARALHNLGYAYAEEGHQSAAKIYFQKSLQISPGFVLARLNLARVFARQGLPEEGLQEYKMLVQIADNINLPSVLGLANDALFEAGNLYLQTGQLEKAIESYQEAFARYPSRVEISLILGQIYFDSGNFGLARKYYTNVIRFAPNVAAVTSQLGVISLRENKLDEALQWFLRTLALAPNNASTYSNLGITQALKGNLTAALQAFQKALEIDPNHQEALKNLKALGIGQ